MNKEHVHELLGYENIKIIQHDDKFRFSLDSVLLADFVNPGSAVLIADLGTGNAPIPLFLTLKTNAKIYGVEIQPDVCDLAMRSVKLNNAEDRIKILNADLKNIHTVIGANRFDIVTCNPPYFKIGSAVCNKNDYLTIARHETTVTLEEIIDEAGKLLTDGGSFCLVHRVCRMSEVFRLLEDKRFGLRRMRLVYPKEKGGAEMFLLEARKNRKSDLKADMPIHVYKDGVYTDQIREIFNFKETKNK